MFFKLHANRLMKAKDSDDSTVVKFTDKVQHMVRVHQYGLKDKPHCNDKDVQYATRLLLVLGFSHYDEREIKNIINSDLFEGES